LQPAAAGTGVSARDPLEAAFDGVAGLILARTSRRGQHNPDRANRSPQFTHVVDQLR
jgi:hypothetical protein